MSKKELFKKQRYEYYKGTREILDNELDDFVEDIVERLNTQDFNKRELLKVNQIQDQQIADLEVKLAEKEKEIEQMKKFDDLNKTFFDLFRTTFKEPNKVDDLFNTLKTMQEKQDQDKILFAVEQLEKLL